MGQVDDHLDQFLFEYRRFITAFLDQAQLTFPVAGKLGAFQQFVLYGIDQVHTGLGGMKVFLFLLDILPAKQGLDNIGPGRRAADAVIFQQFAHLFIFHLLAGGFHGTQQCGFRIGFGRCGLTLMYPRFMRTAFAFYKYGHQFFFVAFFFLGVVGIDHAPARLQDLFARSLKLHLAGLPEHGGIGYLTLGIENGDKPFGDQVVDAFLLDRGQA